jgi:phosphoribosylformylglycinamidine synthase
VLGWLFGEDQGRYLMAVASGRLRDLLDAAARGGVVAREVGRTGGDALIIRGEAPISIATLRSVNERWLPAYMAGGPGASEE